MAFGISEGIAAGGALANYFGGRSAAKAQKEAMRRQGQLLGAQGETYRATMPRYEQVLEGLAQQAQRAQMRAGGFRFREDDLAERAAEEDINRRRILQENQLRHRLGLAGVADASIGAALARNQAQAEQEYGAFRRQQAIGAQDQYRQALLSLLGATGPGFGQGGAASAGYGQQGAVYGQQAGQAFGGINSILQNYAYMNALRNLPEETRRDLRSGNYGGGLGGL